MLLPELSGLTDVALLLLRLLLAALFLTSGSSHVRDPEGRGESIGLPPAATRLLGVVELIGGAAVGLGIAAQVGALALMGVMFGAIYKKIFEWKTGFWGEDGGGWFYDLLYLVCALVTAATGGGEFVLVP